MSTETKTCTKCGEAKALDAFSLNGRRGRKPQCKTCLAAKQRDRRAANPEEYRARNNQWRAANLEKDRASHRAAGRKWRSQHPEKVREQRRDWVAKKQLETRSRAARGGAPWTNAELEVALDLGRSSLEAARALGRTFAAVETQRRKARLGDDARAAYAADYRTRNREAELGRVARWTEAHQGLSLGSASNHRKEWTGPELELLADESRSARDLARVLGRTYHSVKSMRTKIRIDPRKARMAGTDMEVTP